MKRKRFGWGNTPAQAAKLRKELGLSIRRSPGPLPHYEARAYKKIVAGSELEPAQHVDALIDALIASRPDAGFLEACSWLDPGILRRELGLDRTDLNDCTITGGENESGPDATPIARGLARNEKGSQR